MRDAVRLALGTLTVLPVPAPTRVDRRTAGRAMVLAPLVGLLLGAACWALLWVLGRAGAQATPAAGSWLLPAVLVVGLLALLTRGLHLDGLADTADGLASGRSPREALEVMRRGDIGPVAVVSLLLVLLVEVAALATVLDGPHGAVRLLGCLVLSRLTLPALCSRGVPAARREGLGAAVAGTVSPTGLATSALLGIGAVVAAALAAGPPAPVSLGPAGLVAGLVTGLVAWRCVRRLGGISGDVLGASVEVAFATSLAVTALLG